MVTITERERHAFERNVRKSYLYTVLMEFGLWIPIWVLYLRDQRHFTLTQITLLDVPFFLLVVFAEIPTGAVADRFGRKVSLALAAGFYAIAIFVFAIATTYPIIFVSYAAWGLSVTFRSGADSALLYDSLKQAGREQDFHKINGRLTACRWSVVLVALLVGAPLAAATSFTFVIKLSAINGSIAFAVALLMHEPRHAADHAHEPYLQTLASGVLEAWRSPPLRYIFLYAGVLMAAVFGPLFLYQQPWLAAHGVGTGSQGLWQAPARAAAIIGALGAGRLLARFGFRRIFVALPVLLVASSLTLAGVDHVGAVGAFIGLGVVNGVQMPFVASYVNERIESRRRATALSAQSVVGSISLAVLNPLGGAIADAWGLRAAFLMFACVCAGLLGAALLLWLRYEPRAAEVSQSPSTAPSDLGSQAPA
jgi:MFS family permease